MTHQEELDKFNKLCDDLESGAVRVAEKVDGTWKVNAWVKETILSGFRLGQIVDMAEGRFSFLDKAILPRELKCY